MTGCTFKWGQANAAYVSYPASTARAKAPLAFLLHQLPDDDLTIARVLADGSQVRTVTVRPTGEVVLHGDGPDRMLAQAHAGQWCEFDLPLPPTYDSYQYGSFRKASEPIYFDRNLDEGN